jgi:hypothetical protein
VTVHREQNMKREDQHDAKIRCLLLTSVSTCFGHHYAHLQENKGPVTVFGVLFWFCWMWLVAIVGRCVVGCEQCSHPTTQRRRCNSNTNKYINIVKTMCGYGEPYPYPERSSPTGPSTSGHASSKGRSCVVFDGGA